MTVQPYYAAYAAAHGRTPETSGWGSSGPRSTPSTGTAPTAPARPQSTSDRNNKNPMTGDGMWNKAGRKHYRHESGAEITYDGNAWCWRIVGQARGYATLGIAKYEVERMVTA